MIEGIEVDKVAYSFELEGFVFTATYLTNPKGESLISIVKDNEVVREFLFPSYKIWNISAHAEDIVAGLKNDGDSGLLIAGSDGLGGNSYQAA